MYRFSVWNDGATVGDATLERQGMFYLVRVQCSCENALQPEVHMILRDRKIKLGTCIPDGGSFTLVKRINSKGIALEDLRFEVASVNSAEQADPEETKDFPLENLPKSYLSADGDLSFSEA